MKDIRPVHAASRVEPTTRLRVYVNAPEMVVPFQPADRRRVSFVLARTDDPAGLDAFGFGLLPAGGKGNPYAAPDKDEGGDRAFPPASFLVPPSLERAEEYPSPFRDLDVGVRRQDLVVQNLTGQLPYTVDIYFFFVPEGCE